MQRATDALRRLKPQASADQRVEQLQAELRRLLEAQQSGDTDLNPRRVQAMAAALRMKARR